MVLDPLQIVSLPVERLGDWVDNVAAQGDDIIAALDLLVSRAHG